jgi:hypothetical protein
MREEAVGLAGIGIDCPSWANVKPGLVRNLLWFDRCKCLLLTHAGMLFAIFDTDVRGETS